jgi:N utilization substance protein B
MDRRQARAAAMKLIYEWEMGGDGGEETVGGILEIKPEEPEYDYTQRMVEGVRRDAEELDKRIGSYTSGWKLERLGRVDLAILRLGAYELSLGELPPGVVISEAVSLAHV